MASIGATGGAGLAIFETAFSPTLLPSVVAPVEPEVEPYAYIVYTDSAGTVKARNGKNGAVDFSGTDAAVVIQNALNGLTPGRQWKERIVLKGDLLLSNTNYVPLKIPTATILEIQGRLLLGNNVNRTMITNSDPTNGNTHIDVVGGQLDGNKNNNTNTNGQTTGWGIVFEKVNYFSIRNTIISTVRVHGISLSNSSKGSVSGVISNNNGIPPENHVSTGGDGIQVYIGCREIDVIGNICVDNDDTGIVVERSTAVRVIGNYVAGSGWNGINLGNASGNVVTGNHSVSNSRLEPDNDGIIMSDVPSNNPPAPFIIGSFKNVVTGNQCFDEVPAKRQAYGIRSKVGGSNIIGFNRVTDNKTGGVSALASDINVYNI